MFQLPRPDLQWLSGSQILIFVWGEGSSREIWPSWLLSCQEDFTCICLVTRSFIATLLVQKAVHHSEHELLARDHPILQWTHVLQVKMTAQTQTFASSRSWFASICWNEAITKKPQVHTPRKSTTTKPTAKPSWNCEEIPSKWFSQILWYLVNIAEKTARRPPAHCIPITFAHPESQTQKQIEINTRLVTILLLSWVTRKVSAQSHTKSMLIQNWMEPKGKAAKAPTLRMLTLSWVQAHPDTLVKKLANIVFCFTSSSHNLDYNDIYEPPIFGETKRTSSKGATAPNTLCNQ